MIHPFKYSKGVKMSLLFRAQRMLMCLQLCRISVHSLGEKKAGCRKPHTSEAIKSLWQRVSYSQSRLLALCSDVSVYPVPLDCKSYCEVPSDISLDSGLGVTSPDCPCECKWTYNQQNYSMSNAAFISCMDAGDNEIVWCLSAIR